MARKYYIYDYVDKMGNVKTSKSKPKGQYGVNQYVFYNKAERDKQYNIYKGN